MRRRTRTSLFFLLLSNTSRHVFMFTKHNKKVLFCFGFVFTCLYVIKYSPYTVDDGTSVVLNLLTIIRITLGAKNTVF